MKSVNFSPTVLALPFLLHHSLPFVLASSVFRPSLPKLTEVGEDCAAKLGLSLGSRFFHCSENADNGLKARLVFVATQIQQILAVAFHLIC